ncbi:MAG: hypothetical protein ACR2HD_07540 [Solirubrobacteraceae bacterium]|nr:MAG: hypothetical protein DLM63_00650 [Solirubrobacterales bacterium]
MFDPRIYRAALVPIVLAVAVAAFSLRSQPAPATTQLASDAFNGPRAFNGQLGLTTLGQEYPLRRPGSVGDSALADLVAQKLAPGFELSTRRFDAQTIDGRRTLETVVGVRPGISAHRIVILSHRDAAGSPDLPDLSGTAALLELAHDVSGHAFSKTIELVSTSGGSGGDAGAADWAAHTASGPIDAVIVLGDLASDRNGPKPLVVPWGAGRGLAPSVLTRTLGTALAAETGQDAGGTPVLAQFARLAIPVTLGEQGAAVARGLPAVLLSGSGERGGSESAPVSQTRLQGFGRTVLRALLALDGVPSLPADQVTRQLATANKLIPEWAVALVVGSLIFPVLVTGIDGLARARRRGEPLGPWLLWVLACGLPFLLAVGLAQLLVPLGLLHAAPPSVVGAGTLPLDAGGAGLLAAEALILSVGLLAIRLVRSRVFERPPSGGAPAGLVVVVACLITIAVWTVNPFAAALTIPMLHLALFALDPELRLRRSFALLLIAIGLVPVGLVALSYGLALALGPLQLAWSALLLVASGAVGLWTLLAWSALLGCVSAAVAAILSREAHPHEASEVTVRGPLGYAGPGSLGGTRSALRR